MTEVKEVKQEETQVLRIEKYEKIMNALQFRMYSVTAEKSNDLDSLEGKIKGLKQVKKILNKLNGLKKIKKIKVDIVASTYISDGFVVKTNIERGIINVEIDYKKWNITHLGATQNDELMGEQIDILIKNRNFEPLIWEVKKCIKETQKYFDFLSEKVDS